MGQTTLCEYVRVHMQVAQVHSPRQVVSPACIVHSFCGGPSCPGKSKVMVLIDRTSYDTVLMLKSASREHVNVNRKLGYVRARTIKIK